MGRRFRWLLGCLLCAVLLVSVVEAEAREKSFAEMLTPQEQEYLEQDPEITVAFSPNKGPIQYRDRNGEQKGISRDVLEQVSSLSGLRFSFVTMSGMEEMRKGIDSGQVQILAGIPVEQQVRDIYEVDFSEPYLDCAYGVLLPRGGSLDGRDKLCLALTVGLDVPEGFQDVQEITRYDTIQACIEAVSEGKADFTYGNSYVLEFYSQGYRYQNLSVVPFSGSEQQICFGVAREDPRLVGILDKAIRYMGWDGMTHILVRNVAVSTQKVSLASWISLNPKASVLAGVLILGLAGLLAMMLINGSRRKAVLLRVEHQRYLQLSEVAREYFYEYNFQTDTLVLNKETADLFGAKEIIRKWSSVLRETNKLEPASRKMLEQLYTVCKGDDQPNAGTINRGLEVVLPVADGNRRWFRLTRAVLYQKGDRPAYSIGKLMDIEEEHKAYHELMEKSVSDRMTGVYNGVAARELIDRVAQSLRVGSFFMLDLDSFKQVNDRFGHQTGDRVIKETAEILKRTFRKDDIIGRVGGDEFIVFAQNMATHAFIEQKCKELQEAVGKIQVGEGFQQSVSIGVAVMEPPCLYEQMFQQADAALYFVKENGRAGYHIYS